MILIVYILWFGWYLYPWASSIIDEEDGWKKWKERDGIALIAIKIVSILNSFVMKFVLLFVWTRPTWWYTAKNPILRFMQFDGWKYELKYIMPTIAVLYFAILLRNERSDSVSKKREIKFALIVNATCFFVDCLGCGFALACSQ